jgi:hypothetical protein
MIESAPVTFPLATGQARFVQPRLLAQAPELAVLALLDVALAISARALLVQHPTLEELADPALESVLLDRARELLARIRPLQRAVHDYRIAVLAVSTAAAQRDHDDLPF